MDFNQWFILFIIINIALYCPGPVTLFLMSNGMVYGYRLTVFCVIGAATAYFIQMLIVMEGINLVLKKFPIVFDVIKTIGAGYFIYLGCKQLLRKIDMSSYVNLDKSHKTKSLRLYFQGLTVGLLNPKSILLFTALFSQFIVANETVYEQNIILMATFLICQFISSSMYAIVGGKFYNSLKNDGISWQQIVLGSLLIILGITMFLAKLS